jgi:hypothetical protein
MAYVDLEDLKIKIQKNMKVIDKLTNREAIVFSIEPLIIEFENGQHKPREPEDLMYQVHKSLT